MKEETASTKYYTIGIDKERNRLFIEAKGFWPNVKEVANYIDDNKRAVSKLSKGFTVLVDSTTAKVPATEVSELQKQALGLLLSLGLSKVAFVAPQNDALKAMAVARVVKNAGTETASKVSYFSNTINAKIWLNQQ